MIIGLGYKARTGKDTAAKFLMRRHGFVRRGFADSLKEACREIFELNDRQLNGDLKEVTDQRWGETPRCIMQRIGTGLCEVYSEDIWVKSLFQYIEDNPRNKKWVIPDVRFENAAKAIKKMNGYVVRVDRDLALCDHASGRFHVSETALDRYDEWDYVINSNGSIADLEKATDTMFWDLGARK